MSAPSPAHDTRRRDAGQTRQNIVEAARRNFVRESYDGVSLRDIAAAAGVDVALIGRYFGNKEALFALVVGGEHPRLFEDVSPDDDLPAFLATLVAQSDEPKQQRRMEDFLVLIRSAGSSVAGPLIRSRVQDAAFEPLSQLIDLPDAATRARLVVAILMGAAVLRTILRAGPADGWRDYEPNFRHLFEAALTGPLEARRADARHRASNQRPHDNGSLQKRPRE